LHTPAHIIERTVEPVYPRPVVAASTSPETRAAGGTERFRLVRNLGSHPSAWAAIETLPDGRTRVVVVDRAERAHGAASGAAGSSVVDPQMSEWVRGARRLVTLEHPNVVRVRNVIIGADDVLVASEYVDGVSWNDLVQGEAAVSLEIALRVLVDVLVGLSAVHNLRDAKREPLKLVHGALSPGCVIVGLDGIARVTGVARARIGDEAPDDSVSAYLAPEVLLGDDTADARADVYSGGVLLWEALSGRSLFANAPPSAIVTHVLGGRVPPATVPSGAAWAEPLVAATSRALAADPAKRFASAAAFAAEIRRIAAAKLAPPVRVAALVRATFGDRIRARREALERGEVRQSEVAPAGPAATAAADPFESVQRLSAAPTPVPPAHTASTVPPPPLPLAPLRQAERAPPPESATVTKSEPVHLDSIEPEPPSLVPVPKPPPLPKEAHASAPAVTPAPEPTPLAAPLDAPVSAPMLASAEGDAPVAAFAPPVPRAPAPLWPNRRALLFIAAIVFPVVIGAVLLVFALTRSSPAVAPSAGPAASSVATDETTAATIAATTATAATSTAAVATDPTPAATAPTDTTEPTSTAGAATTTLPPAAASTAPWYGAPRKGPKPRYDPQGI
jgi:hypothetical protein